MTKSPEEMAEELAEEWANNRCPKQGREFIGLVFGDDFWCMCKDTFLAGYQAAKDNQEYLMNEISILRSRLDTAEKLSQLVDEQKEQ